MGLIQGHQNGLSQEAVLVRWEMEHAVDGQEDLNKLDDDTLRKKKLAMEETFEKNQIKPGDPIYVYDKEVNFDEVEKVDCDWDMDESEGEENKQQDVNNKQTNKKTSISPQNNKQKPTDENNKSDKEESDPLSINEELSASESPGIPYSIPRVTTTSLDVQENPAADNDEALDLETDNKLIRPPGSLQDGSGNNNGMDLLVDDIDDFFDD